MHGKEKQKSEEPRDARFCLCSKKCAESREMGQSLRGFLYGWGKSFCDQGEQCVKQMGCVFVTHPLAVLYNSFIYNQTLKCVSNW